MHAIREWVDVIDQTVTVRLPAQFQATRVEVIVLGAAESDVKAPDVGLRRRQPSPLLAGTRIIGDIMSPVVDADDWDALR